MPARLLAYAAISCASAMALVALQFAPPASADATLMDLVNDARLNPEKYPPNGNTAGATMTGCPNPLQESGALAGAAQTHNSYLSQQPNAWLRTYPNMHKNADGKLSGDAGGIIEMAGYRSGRWEIVAAGFPTAAAAVQFWMQNDETSQWGHRNIILNCGIREAGAAHLAGGPFGHYWTVDLGNS